MDNLRAMEQDELRRRVEGLNWYHRMDLRGVVTPGGMDPQKKLPRLRFPEDLTGKTVLDVGARDGFYSFAAKRRGASRVRAVDGPSWLPDKPGSHPINSASKATFDLANEVLGAGVESKVAMAEDLSVETVGRFDVVLFLGILYHCVDPIRALANMAEITKELLIIETETDMLFHRRPSIAYYVGRGATYHPGDWCGPNNAFVVDFLGERGFDVEYEETFGFLERVARAGVHAVRNRENPFAVVQRGRSVFWARRR
jgi:tRNA (mo5U34)-methyltransferase